MKKAVEWFAFIADARCPMSAGLPRNDYLYQKGIGSMPNMYWIERGLAANFPA
jgi:hypothetical protein